MLNTYIVNWFILRLAPVETIDCNSHFFNNCMCLYTSNEQSRRFFIFLYLSTSTCSKICLKCHTQQPPCVWNLRYVFYSNWIGPSMSSVLSWNHLVSPRMTSTKYWSEICNNYFEFGFVQNYSFPPRSSGVQYVPFCFLLDPKFVWYDQHAIYEYGKHYLALSISWHKFVLGVIVLLAFKFWCHAWKMHMPLSWCKI